MGSLGNESFDKFLTSLKQAGVVISNEPELRERLAEVQRWRTAFETLAKNGRLLGIRFEGRSTGVNEAEIQRVFTRFKFPESLRSAFAGRLKTGY